MSNFIQKDTQSRKTHWIYCRIGLINGLKPFLIWCRQRTENAKLSMHHCIQIADGVENSCHRWFVKMMTNTTNSLKVWSNPFMEIGFVGSKC